MTIRSSKPTDILQARRVEPRRGRAVRAGEVTYSVVEQPAMSAVAEKRAAGRLRTRLRSGKVLDRDNRFLGECVLYDRSEGGSRLRLHGDVGIPRNLRLYDDERGEVREASIVWRRGHEIGIRLDGSAKLPSPILARLAGRYYAAAAPRPLNCR